MNGSQETYPQVEASHTGRVQLPGNRPTEAERSVWFFPVVNAFAK